jgi:hypothetical protein
MSGVGARVVRWWWDSFLVGSGGSVPLQADDGRVAGLAVERAVVLGELAGLERLGALLALEAERRGNVLQKVD